MKIGRNDPCHCGSGKKYKKCCMQKMSATQPEGTMEIKEESTRIKPINTEPQLDIEMDDSEESESNDLEKSERRNARRLHSVDADTGICVAFNSQVEAGFGPVWEGSERGRPEGPWVRNRAIVVENARHPPSTFRQGAFSRLPNIFPRALEICGKTW